MSQTRTALEEAVRLLSRSDLLSSELSAKLGQKYTGAEVALVLADLKSWGIVDDDRTAAHWADRLSAHVTRGRHLVIAELVRRGVEESAAELLVRSRLSDDGERARAMAVAQAKRSKWKSPDQAARYLSSRGFDSEVVESVIEALFSA